MTTTVETEYNTRHGGPYDRGGADYYYNRGCNPHYYIDGTGTSPRVEREHMTDAEVEAYWAGYDAAAAMGDRKDCGD